MESVQVDPSCWMTTGCGVKMARDETKVAHAGIPTAQEFGEGSEYGRVSAKRETVTK